MINKTDFYKYKGKVFFNVEDPFGYKHKEVEVLAIYENTAAVCSRCQNKFNVDDS